LEGSTLTNKIDLLARVSLLSHMREDDLERIARQTRYYEFQEGDVIITEGDRDNRLFIVITGEVEAIKGFGGKNERCLAVFGPNAYFGEMALIDNLPRSASVVAKKSTRILSLEQWDLRREIEKSPEMATELVQMLSKRIRATEEIIINRLGLLLPICSGCKKIREDNGSWTVIEQYISEHSEAEFSHGICPDCAKRLYPEFIKE
jgi:CRP/FNR family cyclic AMP-dependent transcriptional regulator